MTTPFTIHSGNPNFGADAFYGMPQSAGPLKVERPAKGPPGKRPQSAGSRPASAGRGRVGKLKNAVAAAKPEEEDHFASMPRFANC